MIWKNKSVPFLLQIVGVLAAAAQGGDAKSLQTGSWVAGSATSYNRLLHSSEKKALADEAKALEEKGKPQSDMSWEEVLLLAANAQVDATENARLQALVKSFPPGNPEGQHLAQDLLTATKSIQALASQNTVLTWSDGRTIVANGAEVHAFQATTTQFVDPTLFNTASQWSSNNNWANDPEIVPTAWREQFGGDAVTYLREIAGVSSSRDEFNDLVQRVSTIVGGGIESVTWDLDAALAATGAPAVLRALLARRLTAAGGADTVVVGAKGTTTAGELAGAPPKNPLLDDSIPRDGDRLVLNQGSVPTCGHNSCGMVLDTLGKEVDIGSLIQRIAPSEGGIYARDVASLMTSEGVPASAFGSRNVADLARYTGDGTPVVVRIVDNTKGTDFSHFVVVDGVTIRNGISVVAIRDPHGAQYFSPVSTFQRNFSGEVVVPRSALK